jgi:hypothetical protein
MTRLVAVRVESYHLTTVRIHSGLSFVMAPLKHACAIKFLFRAEMAVEAAMRQTVFVRSATPIRLKARSRSSLYSINDGRHMKNDSVVEMARYLSALCTFNCGSHLPLRGPYLASLAESGAQETRMTAHFLMQTAFSKSLAAFPQ